MTTTRQPDASEPLLTVRERDCDPMKSGSIPSPKAQFSNDTQAQDPASSALQLLTAADIPSASQDQLSKLNRSLCIWHKYRHTHWLWLFTSMLAVCASFFTIYHMGIGLLPGILGLNSAVWGRRYLGMQPAQQLDNLNWFFKVQCILGYVTAAYAVVLGLSIIIFELVCFNTSVQCELLDMEQTARYMQILMGVGYIVFGLISIAAARNASDVEAIVSNRTMNAV